MYELGRRERKEREGEGRREKEGGTEEGREREGRKRQGERQGKREETDSNNSKCLTLNNNDSNNSYTPALREHHSV